MKFAAMTLGALTLALLFAPVEDAEALGTERILKTSDLANPIFVGAPLGDARLFIVERAGKILIYENGSLLDTPFLSLTGVYSESEGGLLGLAFSTDYATSGLFYVYYTTAGPVSRVSQFKVSADPNVADSQSELIFFSIEQPFGNHNGGTLAIRGDYLYLGLGDGGSAGDPDDRAQNNANPFGQIVRWHVETGTPGDLETYAYGLRNPFRFSFDRLNGDLYIGDVGQNAREEINVQPGTDTSLRNYGWDVKEGTNCFDPDPGEPPCESETLTDPVWEYNHSGIGFCKGSVTGGVVYRGALPEIYGHYFFADYCKDTIWSFAWNGGAVPAADVTDRTSQFAPSQGSIEKIVAFGEDGFGEMYIVDLTGEIFRVVPEPAAGALPTGIVALAMLSQRRRHRLSATSCDSAARRKSATSSGGRPSPR